MNNNLVKIPPNSIEAEQAVLGGLLLNQDAYDSVSELLVPDSFYHKSHRAIYEAIVELNNDMTAADIITVNERLNAKDIDVGGLPYLATLADTHASVANIVHYAEIIADSYTKRLAIGELSKITDTLFNSNGEPVDDILASAEDTIRLISDNNGAKENSVKDTREVLKKAIAQIHQRSQMDDGLIGITTGFKDLDKKTHGFKEGELIIVAGRPAMGKSTLAMNMVEAATIGTDAVAAIFTLEMPDTQIMDRMLSSQGGITQDSIKTGRMTDIESKQLSDASIRIAKANIHIDDSSDVTPSQIKARCRRIKKKHGRLDLVMVDYLQLMSVRGYENNRVGEISYITRSLKKLANELRVPVIALSQLNRGLEARPNKRPVLSDLRESGSIEQDADIILFVYRDEIYNEESPDKGIAELIIGKHRQGETGTIRLAFQGQYSRFKDLAKEPDFTVWE